MIETTKVPDAQSNILLPCGNSMTPDEISLMSIEVANPTDQSNSAYYLTYVCPEHGMEKRQIPSKGAAFLIAIHDILTIPVIAPDTAEEFM